MPRPRVARYRNMIARRCLVLAAASALVFAADYRTPAGERPARRTEDGSGVILPGGRLLSPYGAQFTTGPGPFGLAISPNGRRIVTANSGPDYFSLSLLENAKGAWKVRNVSAPKKEKDDPGDLD